MIFPFQLVISGSMLIFQGVKKCQLGLLPQEKTQLKSKIKFRNMIFLFKMNKFHVPALSFSGNRNLIKKYISET